MSTETIDVPEDLRGHIIGKKGRTIKEIIRYSNAKVKNIETGFSVTGTEDQIQKAKDMINSIMKKQESYRPKAQDQEKMSKTTKNTISKEIQVPLYMIRFLFYYNKIHKGRRPFKEIKKKTNTEINWRREDKLLLIGSQRENIQAAEEMINELKNAITEQLLRVELPKDRKIIGLVKGTNGENVKRVQEETQTCIETQTPYVYIYGETKEQQHKAKLKIKEIASNRLKMKKFKEKYQTMSFVDDSFVNDDSDEFSLKPMENPLWRWVGRHHKVVAASKVDNVSPEEKEIEGFEDLVEKVHQKLRQLEERDDRDSFKIDFWCHYGNVYVRNVDEADEGATYSAKELKKHLGEAWETIFDGGLRQLNVDKLKKEYEKPDAVPPYIRYEVSVLSPSCRRFTMKVNLRRNENGELQFTSLDPEIPQESPYKLVSPTTQHMKIHVIILNTDIDYCLNIQTKFTKDSNTHENVTDDDDELKILNEFLDKRLKLENGDLDLIKPNEFPKEYDLIFWRRSERSIFKHDYGFTITTTKEKLENVDGFELEKNVVFKNDVQVHLNNSDKKLSIPKCQSDQTTETGGDELSKQKEQTRKYVEKVLRFAREVQIFFSAQDPPDENE